MKLSVLLIAGVAASASTEGTKGMGAVVDMLKELKTMSETELTDAKSVYADVACNCKDESKAASDSIVEEQGTIDDESAETESQYQTEQAEKKKMQDALAARTLAENEKKEWIVEYQTATAKSHKVIADLVAAEYALENAIDAMKASKPTMFLKIKDEVKKSILLAEMLGMRKAKLAKESFLQMDQPTQNANYAFHGSGIIETLEDLHKEFTDKKTAATAEQKKRTTVMTTTMNAKNAKITAQNDAFNTATTNMNAAIKAKGEALDKVKAAKDTLTTQNQVLIDLTHQCEVKAQEFDLRHKTLSDEAAVYKKVLEILTDGNVKDSYKSSEEHTARQEMVAEYGNSRNVGLSSVGSKLNKIVLPEAPVAEETADIDDMEMMSFLQKSKVMTKVATMIKSRWSQKKGKDAAIETLKETKSESLIKIADKIASATETGKDVFKKVKGLIQGLIERLLAEAAAEATKKGMCDTQIGKTSKERDYAFDDVKKINNELAELEAQLEEAENTITEMGHYTDETDKSGTIGDDTHALNQATQTRKDEKAANVQILADNQRATAAVKQAITALKEFYASASRTSMKRGSASLDNSSTAAVQGSNVDMNASAEKGNQSGGQAAIMMLSNILHDFETATEETQQAEKDAYTLFTEYARSLKVAIAESETILKNAKNTKDLSEAEIAEGMNNLKTSQDIVDSKVKLLQDLRPQCVDTGMSYEEKKAKREKEICALDTAATQLDPNGEYTKQTAITC